MFLVLDRLLDFLGLHRSRSCNPKMTLLQLLALTLSVALSQGHWRLITKEEVLFVNFKVGRRALFLITVLRCLWLHHHALAPAQIQRICLNYR